MKPIDYEESQNAGRKPYSPPGINWCVGVDWGVDTPVGVLQSFKLEPIKLPEGKSIYEMTDGESVVLKTGRATKKSTTLTDFRLLSEEFNDPAKFADHLRSLGVDIPEGNVAWVTGERVMIGAGDKPVVEVRDLHRPFDYPDPGCIPAQEAARRFREQPVVCSICGKEGCRPMNHAGWHPDDEKGG